MGAALDCDEELSDDELARWRWPPTRISASMPTPAAATSSEDLVPFVAPKND